MSILTDHSAETDVAEGGFDLLASREYVAPRANLLPPEIGERLALRRLTAAMVAAVVACGGIVGGLYVTSESGRAPARAALADAQTQHTGLVAQQATLAPFQVAHEKVLAAKKALQDATASEVLWSNQLNTLRANLPDGVRLSSLSVAPSGTASTGASAAVTLPAAPAGTTGSTATTGATTATTPAATIATVALNGDGVSNFAVANLLDSLATLKGWTNVYLGSLATDTAHKGLVTFSITANISDKVLSHRYANGS